MGNNSNFNMFFYGMWGMFVQFIGFIGLFASFVIGALADSGVMIIVGLVISIGLIIWGKAIRFDYKRQSGSIIHRGDW